MNKIDSDDKKQAPPVEAYSLVYARLMAFLAHFGFVLVLITFFLYVSGTIEPRIPIQKMPQQWQLSALDYLKANQLHGGWNWVKNLDKGDCLSFAGIAFLAGVTLICYFSLLVQLVRKKKWVLAAFVVGQLAILLLAASGILRRK